MACAGSGRAGPRAFTIGFDRDLPTNGLDQLTMRRLGAELGVDPMTIYEHVPDKTALFDGLVELVLAEVTLPGRTGHWGHDFRAAAHAARATLLAHPHLIPLLGTRPPVTQPAFTLWESLTSILLDAGLSEELAATGPTASAGSSSAMHSPKLASPSAVTWGGGEEEHRQAQAALAAARYPALSRVQQANIVHDPRRIFELALDGLILALQAHHPHD